jgi:hypothetical protein
MVLSVFIVYIVFPIKTPARFASFIDNIMGILAILIVTLYLFFFTNPILGVVYLMVGYELIRRSSQIVNRIPIIQYVPSERTKQQEMVKMNIPSYTTLEEEIVGKRGHVDVSKPILYDQPTYKPIAENVGGASLI